MAVQRRSRLVRAKSDRQMIWIGVDIDSTAVAASTVILLGVLNAAALALWPFTVVRSRYRMLWTSDQIAASEQPHGAAGCMVVSDQASATGVTAIPDPVTNSDAPWFMYEPLILRFEFGSAIGFQSPSGFMVDVDSKAMRKVGNNEDVVTIVTNSDAASGALISMQGRMLIKLH